MKNKRNPVSFLEDSFSSIKEYLETEINSPKMILSTSFIQQLESETKDILALCENLNKDDAFIYKINSSINPKETNGLLLKAEHFFISDIIKAYDCNAGNETEKSLFTLAYYYDALRNHHFADANAVNTLNKLIYSQEFKRHLDKIKKENKMPSAENALQKKYFVPSVLSEINNPKSQQALDKIKQFLHFAYGLKFSDNDELHTFLGFNLPFVSPENKSASAVPQGDTLEKVMEDLNQLIGLDNVKKDIAELINLLEIQKKRSEQGLKNIDITLHTVFLGPPGTGKTTVARLLGRIFKHLGFLSKGQLCETDREGMVAGYVGQTASKVDKIVEQSIGGVLFIDEAYSLTQNSLGGDYGSEAVNTLLKRMEDQRDDLAVIVAGYTDPMKVFVESNPGLRSRFNRFFYFKHFTPSEMIQIFESFCKKSDFIISEEAKEKLNDTFELLYEKKDENFGNARVVRNLFEKCIQNQANRIIKLSEINREVLKTFAEEDIPEPKETQKQVSFSTTNENS